MSRTPKKSPAPKSASVKLSVVSAAEAGPAEPLAPPATPDEVESTPAAVSVILKKKDFVERVATRSGAKKPVVRDLTEVVLATLAEALAAGETLVLPPLGKLSVARGGAKAGGDMLHLKLKKLVTDKGGKKAEDSGADPLAEAED